MVGKTSSRSHRLFAGAYLLTPQGSGGDTWMIEVKREQQTRFHSDDASLYLSVSPDGALWSVEFGEYPRHLVPHAAVDWSGLQPAQRREHLLGNPLPEAVKVAVRGFLDVFERDYQEQPESPSLFESSSPTSSTQSLDFSSASDASSSASSSPPKLWTSRVRRA